MLCGFFFFHINKNKMTIFMEHFAFTILCTVTLITALPLSSVTCLQQYVIETGDTLLNWSVEDRNLLLLLCTFMIELVIGFAAKLIVYIWEHTF